MELNPTGQSFSQPSRQHSRQQSDHRYPVQFSGKTLEYFGIWIVNICLTIITLGIYSAWAKVRTYRYFYGNTQVDDSAFEYLASPMTILRSRAIAVVLLGAYSYVERFYPGYAGYALLVFAVLVPAIIVMAMSFRMRNTAYRGLVFHFKQNFKQAYLVYGIPFIAMAMLFIGISLLVPEQDLQSEGFSDADAELLAQIGLYYSIAMFVAFLLWPLWRYFQACFMVNNTSYGKSALQLAASKGEFYRIYLAAFLIFVIAMVAVLLLFAVFTPESIEHGKELTSLGFIYLLMIGPLYIFLFTYIQTKRLNLVFDASRLDDIRFESRLSVGYMFYLYLSNTLAIVCSLGLLIPWALIRTARYRAQTLTLVSVSSLDHFVAEREADRSAIGEEMGEVFDMDIGL